MTIWETPSVEIRECECAILVWVRGHIWISLNLEEPSRFTLNFNLFACPRVSPQTKLRDVVDQSRNIFVLLRKRLGVREWILEPNKYHVTFGSLFESTFWTTVLLPKHSIFLMLADFIHLSNSNSNFHTVLLAVSFSLFFPDIFGIVLQSVETQKMHFSHFPFSSSCMTWY